MMREVAGQIQKNLFRPGEIYNWRKRRFVKSWLLLRYEGFSSKSIADATRAEKR